MGNQAGRDRVPSGSFLAQQEGERKEDEGAVPSRNQPFWRLSSQQIDDLVRRGLRPDMALLPFQMPRMSHDGIPLPPPVESDARRLSCSISISTRDILLKDLSGQFSLRLCANSESSAGVVSFHFLCTSRDVWNNVPFHSVTIPAGLDIPIQLSGEQMPCISEFSSMDRNMYSMIIVAESPNSFSRADHSRKQMTFTKFVLEGNVWSCRISRQQIVLEDGTIFQVQELFEHGTEGRGDCVVCMTSLSDTAVLPCRHLCLCVSCAAILRAQSNRCPICRSRMYFIRLLLFTFSQMYPNFYKSLTTQTLFPFKFLLSMSNFT